MNYNEFKENGWLAPVSAVRNGEWTDGRIIETLWDYREDEVNPSPGRHPTSTVSNWRVTTLTATSRCTACRWEVVVTRSCSTETGWQRWMNKR